MVRPPSCIWLKLAWKTVTAVAPEVVTGTRVHDLAVLAVERGHRALVALADPAQQLSIVAGTVASIGESGGTAIPVRIVHR